MDILEKVDVTELLDRLDNLNERLKKMENQKAQSNLSVGDISLASSCDVSKLSDTAVNLLTNKTISGYLGGEHFARKRMHPSYIGE